MMGLYEGILGIKRDYEGLRIDPAFPAEWKQAQVKRHFRNAEYEIFIENPEQTEKGALQILADGMPIEGNLLPDYRDGKCHKIQVIISSRDL